MLFTSALSAVALLAQQAVAQAANPTSSYYAPGIPTDTPVPGNYTDHLRPRVHFSPPRYFMNDPNGMHRDPTGLWHLYYQYNPLTPVAGNQHWGHATSEDLYTWTNQKIPFFPPNNYTYIFSGSAVVDANNTSGFFPDQDNGVVAIYTLAEYPGGVQGVQYQAIAYSRDSGYTFEAYENNPVLNINSTQFRDPYVIWHEGSQQWVMVIAYAAEYVIGFFTSPDLKEWTHASNFTREGYLGTQYECPNLVQLPMTGQDEPVWVLQLSINPGGPRGGSISEYFPGDFDGTTFTPYDNAVRFTDFGKDNYAAQFFHGVPAGEPQIALGWASNWQYTQQVPTGLLEHGQFRSAMTVPRSNTLANMSVRGYDLIAAPYNIYSVVDRQLALNDTLGNGTVLASFADSPSGAMYFEANVTDLVNPSVLKGQVNFTISSSISGEYIQGGINIAGTPTVWVNRGNIRGFDHPYFTDKFSEEAFISDIARSQLGAHSLSVICDNSVLEVFVNGAQQAATLTFFPERALDTLAVYVGGLAANVSSSVGAWSLKDPWADQANDDGVVIGNNTAMGYMQMF